MDDYLDRSPLEEYIFALQEFRKQQKAEKFKEEARLKRFFERNAQRLTEEKLADNDHPNYHQFSLEFEPEITDEFYEKNHNNPAYFPVLKGEDQKEPPDEADEFGALKKPIGSTRSKIVSSETARILEMEKRLMEEQAKKLRPAEYDKKKDIIKGPNWNDEVEFDKEEGGIPHDILIVKKQKKKKNGKK